MVFIWVDINALVAQFEIRRFLDSAERSPNRLHSIIDWTEPRQL
jgi:hypothetical protein